ncbi:hypothetical protein [Chloroflexus sp.]|uniref:hypothetical protein n=1 Tax=Chloroflexus sp. TaxID=1904827 RepID=UPI002ACE5FD4|nr:hypothetical protein [Chloroflexus sp.]
MGFNRMIHSDLWRKTASIATVLWLALGLFLGGCGAAALEENVGLGGVTPEAVVESFLEDINAALADPLLNEAATRQMWANRLASYFAPGERADQRQVMREMLDGFASANTRPARGSRAEVTISYDRTRVLRADDRTALVEIVNAVMIVRWRDNEGNLLLERNGALLRLIGREESGLPVIRVDGRWYLTEAG